MRKQILKLIIILIPFSNLEAKTCGGNFAQVDGRPAKFSYSLRAKVNSAKENMVAGYVVVDTFLPITGRRSQPALLALRHNIIKAGARIDDSFDKTQTIPRHGLVVIKVTGLQQAFWNLASMSQVKWLTLSVGPETLIRLREERGLSNTQLRDRYDLELRLQDKYLARIESERLFELQEQKRQLELDLEYNLSAINKIKTALTSAQDSSRGSHFLLLSELRVLQAKETRLYNALDRINELL